MLTGLCFDLTWMRCRCFHLVLLHGAISDGGAGKCLPDLQVSSWRRKTISIYLYISNVLYVMLYDVCRLYDYIALLVREIMLELFTFLNLLCFTCQVISAEAMGALFFSSSAPTPDSDPKCSPPSDAWSKTFVG